MTYNLVSSWAITQLTPQDRMPGTVAVTVAKPLAKFTFITSVIQLNRTRVGDRICWDDKTRQWVSEIDESGDIPKGAIAIGDTVPPLYSVTVGNVGQVYLGYVSSVARRLYGDYVMLSRRGSGRAGNEKVTLWKDGEPLDEHFPSADAVLVPVAYKIKHERSKHHYWIERMTLGPSGPRWFVTLRLQDVSAHLPGLDPAGYETAQAALSAWTERMDHASKSTEES